MRAEIQGALSKSDSFDFLYALEGAYDYHHPEDFRRISEEGRMVVSLRCFSQCLACGGYGQVIAELHDWLPDISHALRRIDDKPFAEAVDAIIQRASALGIDIHDEDGADELEKLDDYHRLASMRDIPHVHRLSASLRRYVQ